MRAHNPVGWLGLVLAALLAVSVAHADPTSADRQRARDLMDQADRKVESRDLTGALADYRTAHAIMGVPTTGIEVAKTQSAMGLLIEARETALQIAAAAEKPGEAKVQGEVRAQARELAMLLERRIPAMHVVVKGVAPSVDVKVEIDSARVAGPTITIKLNPGAHRVTATARGYGEASQTVTLREAETRDIEMALTAAKGGAAPAASSGHKDVAVDRSVSTLTYVGFGIGAAGIVVGSVFGAMSWSKKSTIQESCDAGNGCPVEAAGEKDKAMTLAYVSDAGFAVAIVGVGLGVYGLLTSGGSASKSTGSPRVNPLVGVNSVGLSGAF
jgi:hypothetical protein